MAVHTSSVAIVVQHAPAPPHHANCFPRAADADLSRLSAMTLAPPVKYPVVPPWQVMQSCVAGSTLGAAGVAGRSRRADPLGLCSMWQEVQAFRATVGYEPTFASIAT